MDFVLPLYAVDQEFQVRMPGMPRHRRPIHQNYSEVCIEELRRLPLFEAVRHERAAHEWREGFADIFARRVVGVMLVRPSNIDNILTYLTSGQREVHAFWNQEYHGRAGADVAFFRLEVVAHGNCTNSCQVGETKGNNNTINSKDHSQCFRDFPIRASPT